MIALIDYGAGNLRSVERALAEASGDVRRVNEPGGLKDASCVVLPGVGHFGQAMHNLAARKLDGALRERVIEDKIPYIGLCLGLQLLFESSEEAPGVRGLGWLPGAIRKFKSGVKIPHMGWNDIKIIDGNGAFTGLTGSRQFFYFVHSYFAVPSDPSIVAATADYPGPFCCAVRAGNIFAVQFHPEKSQTAGRQLLRNLIASSI